MANEEHLEILRQGVEVWNRWRKERRDIQPDLQESNLKNLDLERADLILANLAKADLSEMVLTRAELGGANLSGANLSWTDLTCTDLSEADLTGAFLRGAGLNETNFSHANLKATDFRGAYMGFTIFGDVDLGIAHGLEDVIHQGPSIIGIDTLQLSRSETSKIFFQQAGVPPYLLDYIDKTRTPTDCLYTPEQIDNWVNEAKDRLVIYEKNILVVKERMAQKGAFKHVPDVNELEEYERKVEEIRAEIAEWKQHQKKGCPICAGKH